MAGYEQFFQNIGKKLSGWAWLCLGDPPEPKGCIEPYVAVQGYVNFIRYNLYIFFVKRDVFMQ